MSITKRLFLLLLVSALAMVGLELFNMYEMGRIYNAANYGNVNSVPSLELLSSASNAVRDLENHTYLHIVNTDHSQMAAVEKSLQENRAQLDKALKDYERLLSDDRDRQLLTDDRAAIGELYALVDRVLVLSRANKNDEARDVFTSSNAVGEKANHALDLHMKYNMDHAEKGSKDAAAIRKNGMTMAVIFGRFVHL